MDTMLNNSTKMLIHLSVLILLILDSQIEPTACFWLTDGISLQPATSFVKQPSRPAAEVSTETVSPAPSGDDVKLIGTNAFAATNRLEPWVWLTGAQQADGKQQQQLQSSNRSIGDNNSSRQQPNGHTGGPQVCQCNADWLQNQTNNWLNKWLASPNFANQMRSLVLSNSTGATSRKDAKHSSGNNGNHHLSAWVRAKGNNNGNINSNNTSAGGGRARSKWSHPGAAGQQHQQTAAPVRLVAGERGPKGEQGARGDRGPSGLISVKDRDALFDLDESQIDKRQPVDNGNQKQASGSMAGPMLKQERTRLVFVESEQMLVVDTISGWRPVQMLAPLRDFRKTIAKFSLTNQEDRRRLLEINVGGDAFDNSIGNSLMRTGAVGRPIGANLPDDDLNDDLAQDFDVDDDDDDDEDDDDDDDEDDETDGDEDDDDEQDVGEANAKSGAGLVGYERQQPADKTKRRRAQVSSRSAASGSQLPITTVGADNSLGVPLVRSAQVTPSPAQPTSKRTSDGHAMRLRLIALNEPFSGNVHGLRGANFECKRNAAKANIKGAFRAFLATNYQNLNEIVRYNAAQKHPVVNLRGETLARSWHDLFKHPARMTNPLSRIYSFDGRHVATDSNWPNKLVWHGAGNKFGYRDSLHNCDGWHSDSMSKFGYASPLHTPRGSPGQSSHGKKQQRSPRKRFVEDYSSSSNHSTNHSPDGAPVLDAIEKYPCRMPLIVLCIETVAQAD